MEKETKSIKETKKNDEKKTQLNLPIIISAAVGTVAVIAIVLVLVLGGGKKNNANNAGGNVDNGTSDNSESLNPEDWPDNIDPDGWTKVDK